MLWIFFFPLEVKKNKQSVYLLSGKKRGGNSIQEQQPNKNPDQIIQESVPTSGITHFCLLPLGHLIQTLISRGKGWERGSQYRYSTCHVCVQQDENSLCGTGTFVPHWQLQREAGLGRMLQERWRKSFLRAAVAAALVYGPFPCDKRRVCTALRSGQVRPAVPLDVGAGGKREFNKRVTTKGQ